MTTNEEIQQRKAEFAEKQEPKKRPVWQPSPFAFRTVSPDLGSPQSPSGLDVELTPPLAVPVRPKEEPIVTETPQERAKRITNAPLADQIKMLLP